MSRRPVLAPRPTGRHDRALRITRYLVMAVSAASAAATLAAGIDRESV